MNTQNMQPALSNDSRTSVAQKRRQFRTRSQVPYKNYPIYADIIVYKIILDIVVFRILFDHILFSYCNSMLSSVLVSIATNENTTYFHI